MLPRQALRSSIRITASGTRVAEHRLLSSLGIDSSVWTNQLSFASPDADFCAFHSQSSASGVANEWSHRLTFASPEADFASQVTRAGAERDDTPDLNTEFSQEMSFATPETDFTAQNIGSSNDYETEWSGGLSFSSPESDFLSHKKSWMQSERREWSEKLSFATPSADFTSVAVADDKVAPLPKNMSQAMHDTRAVVVTSALAPFKVIDVNDAWVGLCGYSREEAVGKDIGNLLQGPSTDNAAARIMLEHLEKEDYGETLLTNYTKEGRQFRNMIRTAPLPNDDGAVEHFVGVLHELGMSERTNLSQS